jgi:hypothetical protein
MVGAAHLGEETGGVTGGGAERGTNLAHSGANAATGQPAPSVPPWPLFEADILKMYAETDRAKVRAVPYNVYVWLA